MIGRLGASGRVLTCVQSDITQTLKTTKQLKHPPVSHMSRLAVPGFHSWMGTVFGHCSGGRSHHVRLLYTVCAPPSAGYVASGCFHSLARDDLQGPDESVAGS